MLVKGAEKGVVADGIGHLLLRSGCPMDPHTQRLAALEPIGQIQRTRCWRTDTSLVVERQ